MLLVDAVGAAALVLGARAVGGGGAARAKKDTEVVVRPDRSEMCREGRGAYLQELEQEQAIVVVVRVVVGGIESVVVVVRDTGLRKILRKGKGLYTVKVGACDERCDI